MHAPRTVETAADSFFEALQAHGGYDSYEIDGLRRKLENAPASSMLHELVADNRIPGKTIGKLWGDSIRVAHVTPLDLIITDEAIAAFPFEVVTKAKVIGLHMVDGVLTVAMTDPLDGKLIANLQKICGHRISPVFALPGDIDEAIAVHYKGSNPMDAILHEARLADIPSLQSLDEDGLMRLAQATPVIKLFDSIVYFTLQARGTDIHLQPEEHGIALRVRIDGFLQTIGHLPINLGPALVTRAKVLCKLDIAEMRLPQDGRFSRQVGGINTHFRASSLPTIHGEKLVIRVLGGGGNNSGAIPLDKMQISRPVLEPVRRLIRSPNGIIFVTGPTGSGKTSTLYALLQEINEPNQNVVTIEDPVEYQLHGLTQVQVNRASGLDFAMVLRSVLRQDPDVLLVGEIRDLETARIASEAALTGHLVFATLHTNNASQAVLRLTEMGVEPYIVAPSVIGVVAQRLARRICEFCSESFVAPPELLKRFFYDADDLLEVILHRGRGCEHCGGTGYHGRLGIHELIVITDEMRELILAGGTAGQLSDLATKNGTRSLRYDALSKALLGLTTIEEVERVTIEEWE